MTTGAGGAIMKTTLQWRFDALGNALRSEVGERIGRGIRVRGSIGRALCGPNMELPSGLATARIIFAGTRRGLAKMKVTAGGGRRVIAARNVQLGRTDGDKAELQFNVDEPLVDVEVRLICRFGVNVEIVGVEIDLERELSMEPLNEDRPVGFESRKTYAAKVASGFFDRYLSGPNIMEVGYKGYDGGTVPIVPQAVGVDVGYAGYDGSSFPFADESFDGVYSSHCFEHIAPWKEILRDWYRILKVGGFLVIVVPHQMLFERKRYLPSYFNPDHKRYYTARSLLAELEEAFEENSYRIRHLIENDQGFDYQPAPGQGSSGCYEIELVVEKIERPYWTIDDGSVRSYPAGEFRTSLPRSSPWSVVLDLSQPHQCLVYGPYISLPVGAFEVEFHLAGFDGTDEPALLFDVAQDASRIASVAIKRGSEPGSEETRPILLPFRNDRANAVFEFRIYSVDKSSAARPAFMGIVLRYAAAPQ